MDSQKFWARPLDHPKTLLISLYTAWKSLLACTAFLSPGLGYDTSTSLLYLDNDSTIITSWSIGLLEAWLRRLTRWDAIYFTHIARYNYVWEQEWAFGWGFTRLIALLSKAFALVGYSGPTGTEALTGVTLSHVSHLVSILILHELTLAVYSTLCQPKRSRLAIVTASLHIISPAGMFLTAPYAESSFAVLNFFGFYCYTKTFEDHSSKPRTGKNISLVAAGIMFGAATTFRGNGLLSGLVLVYDAMTCTIMILRARNVKFHIRRLIVVCISGILMACIAVVPQYVAYDEYCRKRNANRTARPWCSAYFPSIYGWVQEEYWGAGMFRYWTFSNLPLFLLAGPMLCILFCSGLWAWSNELSHTKSGAGQAGGEGDNRGPQNSSCDSKSVVAQVAPFRYALPQIILAALALSTYHVQIITRLSSGYPVWYWWLASLLLENQRTTFLGLKIDPASLITRWMVIYAIVQGGLFASFLPPA